MQKRLKLDQLLLEIYEDLTASCRSAHEKLDEYNQDCSEIRRFLFFEEKLATERRMLEEVSLPCRLILEHLTIFLGNYEQSIGYRVGNYLTGRSVLIDFAIGEWDNIILDLGNIQLAWRDAEYKYLFYPDKVILRPGDINKPEINLNFNFHFRHSHVLEKFVEIMKDPQVEYWHEDLNL